MKSGLSWMCFCVALLLATAWMGGQSVAAGCTFSGAKLDCTDGGKHKKLSQITEAFASEETRKLLSDPQEELARFEVPIKREHFRRSVEKSWRAINRYARYNRRQVQRKRITDEEYWKRVATHNEALETYKSAYWFYKNLNWQAE